MALSQVAGHTSRVNFCKGQNVEMYTKIDLERQKRFRPKHTNIYRPMTEVIKNTGGIFGFKDIFHPA